MGALLPLPLLAPPSVALALALLAMAPVLDWAHCWAQGTAPQRAVEAGRGRGRTLAVAPAAGWPPLQGALPVGPRPSRAAACGWCCCRRRRQSPAVRLWQRLSAGSLGWGMACWLLTEHGPARKLPLLIWRRLAPPSASRGCGWAPATPHPGLAPPLHGITPPHVTAIC